MVDTMIDRMLFGWFQDNLVSVTNVTPSAVGWTPMKGGYRALQAQFPGVSWMADKSAWDWTVVWQHRLLFETIRQLAGHPDQAWMRIAKARFDLLFEHSVYQFPSEVLVRQTTPGVMKSGCLLTIAGNTVMQMLLHSIVARRLGLPFGEFRAGGDDTIQDPVPDPKAYLAEMDLLGVIIKETKLSAEPEFLGMRYPRGGLPVPLYQEKHLVALSYMDLSNARQIIHSFLQLYAGCPEWYSMLEGLALRCGWADLSSPQEHRSLWLG